MRPPPAMQKWIEANGRLAVAFLTWRMRRHADPMLHGWENFYVMAGTAAATLAGLLFVVMTLGIQLSASHAAHGVHAFVTPTLVHFGGVLFQSLTVLAPWPSPWPLAIILGLCGIAGLAYGMIVIRKLRRLDFVSLDFGDWMAYAGAPELANASLVAGAAGPDHRQTLCALRHRRRRHAAAVRRHPRRLGPDAVDWRELAPPLDNRCIGRTRPYITASRSPVTVAAHDTDRFLARDSREKA
jgi:hypothetical protein